MVDFVNNREKVMIFKKKCFKNFVGFHKVITFASAFAPKIG